MGVNCQLQYSEDIWLAVLERAGYPRSTVFGTYTVYPDNVLNKLGEAAAAVINNGSSADDFIAYFGRCFVLYSHHFGHDKVIKVHQSSPL